eukprot:tig00021038_g17582.t1
MGCGAGKPVTTDSPPGLGPQLNAPPPQASEPVVIEPVKAPPVLLDRPPRHPSLAVSANVSVNGVKKGADLEDDRNTIIKSPLASAVLNYAFDDNYKKEVEKALQTSAVDSNPAWQRSKSRSLLQPQNQANGVSTGEGNHLSTRPVSPGYCIPDPPPDDGAASSPLPFEPARVDRTLCIFLCAAALEPAVKEALFAQSIPKLRYACARRGLVLCVTDLLDASAVDAKSLSRGLRQLERSQYFVALVGDAYEPAAVPSEVLAEVPELRGRGLQPGAGLLDLFLDAGPLSPARRGGLGPRALFVWHGPAAAAAGAGEGQQGPGAGPDAAGGPASAPSPAAAALRRRAQAVGQHRESKSAGQACKFVERGLAGAIDRDFPSEQSAQVIARTAHAQLTEHLLREAEAGGHVEPAALEEAFLRAVEAPPGAREPVCLVGPAGSGKSTFLARWAERHRRSNPRDVVVLHHVAAECVADPVPPAVVLARLAQELAARFGIERESLPTFYAGPVGPAGSSSPLPASASGLGSGSGPVSPPRAFPSFSSLSALASVSISGRASEVLGASSRRPSSAPPTGDHFCAALAEVLARAAAACRGRLFVVLDGLERVLEAQEGGDALAWLPPPAALPPNVTLVAAARPGRSAEALQSSAAFRPLPVPPLEPAERAALAEALGVPPALAAEHPACDRPGGLRLVARAARAAGPEAAARAESPEALWDLLLGRAEEEMGREALRILRLVRCSRAGLSEPELVHLVGLPTHAAAVDVLEGLQAAGALVRLAGLYTLPSMELVAAFDRRQFARRAASVTQLQGPPSPSAGALQPPSSAGVAGLAANTLAVAAAPGPAGLGLAGVHAVATGAATPGGAPSHPRRTEALRTLREHFAAYPSCVRRAQELPWALHALGESEAMERVLAELPLMDAFLRGGLEAELASAWRAAVGGSPAAPTPALSAAVGGAVFDAYRAALRPSAPPPPSRRPTPSTPRPAGRPPRPRRPRAERRRLSLEMLRVVEGDAAPLSDDGAGGASPFLTPAAAAAPSAGARRPSSLRQRPSYAGSSSSMRAGGGGGGAGGGGSIRSLDAVGSSVRSGSAYGLGGALALPEGAGLSPLAFAEAAGEALQALEAALELEERAPARPGAVSAAIATLRALAGLCFERAEYERAAGLLEEAALAHQQLPSSEGGGPLAAAALLMALARVHRTRMDREKALALADEALRLQRGAVGAAHHELSGHLPGALDGYQKALPVLERVFGPCHPRVSQTLTAIGDIYRMRGLLEEALPIYQRATEIRVKFLGSDQHAEVANLLATEAGMLKDVGQLDAALEIYERVLRIQTACLGPKSPKVSVTINCIDATKRAIKEAEKAAGLRAMSVDQGAAPPPGAPAPA